MKARRLKPKQFAPNRPYVARIVSEDTTIHRLIETTDDLEAYWKATEASMHLPSTRQISVKPLTRQTTFQHPFQIQLIG